LKKRKTKQIKYNNLLTSEINVPNKIKGKRKRKQKFAINAKKQIVNLILYKLVKNY